MPSFSQSTLHVIEPSVVNFNALATRLLTICVNHPTSASTRSGTASDTSSFNRFRVASARFSNPFTTRLNTSRGAKGVTCGSAFPLSNLSKSSTSVNSPFRCFPANSMYDRCDSLSSSPDSSRIMSSIKPKIAFKGVRISWLITDKKSDLWRSASAARVRASWTSVTSTAYMCRKGLSWTGAMAT